MKKEITIKAWGLSNGKNIYFPIFHTKKEAKKKRFVEDIVKIEIKVIKREKIISK